MDLEGEGEGEGEHQICSFMWADNFWIISHSARHLEQMLKDLIEEAAKVDLEPRPVCGVQAHALLKRRRRRSWAPQQTGCYKFPSEDEFRILGSVMNRQGKTCDTVEVRMQSVNKAF